MDIEGLKELEAKATPGPWKNRELICYREGQATSPPYELTSDMQRPYPWDHDGRLIAALRALAPELIALWEAAEELTAPEDYCDDVRSAVRDLNEKIRSMELREKIAAMPTREESLGGQRFKYVQLGEVLGYFDEIVKPRRHAMQNFEDAVLALNEKAMSMVI